MLLQYVNAQIGVAGESFVLIILWETDLQLKFSRLALFFCRMGIARLAETPVRAMSGKSEKEALAPMERILCSSIGGALGCWNQPIEVVRVEMQSMAKAEPGSKRPAKLTIGNTLSYVYKENGIKGLYRGVQPRIALGIWQTICMVTLADYVKVRYRDFAQKQMKNFSRG